MQLTEPADDWDEVKKCKDGLSRGLIRWSMGLFDLAEIRCRWGRTKWLTR